MRVRHISAVVTCQLLRLALASCVVLLGRLVEQEVSSKLLIFVASEVGLDDEITLEAQLAKLRLQVSFRAFNDTRQQWKTYPLNSHALLFRHANLPRTGRQLLNITVIALRK